MQLAEFSARQKKGDKRGSDATPAYSFLNLRSDCVTIDTSILNPCSNGTLFAMIPATPWAGYKTPGQDDYKNSGRRVIDMHFNSDTWIVYFKKNPGARLRLFCFPYGGGGANVFRLWSSLLPPEVELGAIQLPGRENRFKETPLNRLEPLVETLADVMQPVLDKPFAFFGHSLGAIVSFELARTLRRKSRPQPAGLFVSGCGAPQQHRHQNIHQLPEPEFIEAVKKYNGISEEIIQSKDLMQLILPCLYGDFSVFETYQYVHQPPLNCPISAYGGLEDDNVTPEELAAWKVQTINQFEVQMFPGDHFFVNSAYHSLLGTLSDKLRQLPAQN